MQENLDVSLQAVPMSVREARQTIGEIATKAGAPPRVLEDIRLCVSEAVANVVRHAYGRDEGDVAIVAEHQGAELTVVVRDEGVGLTHFKQDGDLGWGLRIIEELSTRCAITSAPGAGTEVRMVFALDAAD